MMGNTIFVRYAIIMRRLIIYLFTYTFIVGAFAQNNKSFDFLNESLFSNPETISDKQVDELFYKMKSMRMDIKDLEKIAQENRISPDDWNALKIRLENREKTYQQADDLSAKNENESIQLSNNNENKTDWISYLKPKVFGMDFFKNKKLSFEPGLSIPTPQNYVLGAGDELQIDLFGSVEQSYKLKINPDGYIRLPLAGTVQLSGLSMEQARARLHQSLAKVYPRMRAGEIQMHASLGTPRSIRVHIIGDVENPGSYTIPAFATVFNALYACGGPNEKGSLRNIQVIRNNKVVASLDVYHFLMKGSASGNIRLNDQDIIRIPTCQARVFIKGYCKTEAYFEIITGDKLSNLLEYAGGFDEQAYRKQIKVTRNTSEQKKVDDVDQTQYTSFLLQAGDCYEISAVLNRFENRVRINGAVFRPGSYAIEKGLSLKQLIQKAEGVKEDAFMSRAIIYRLKEDNTNEMLSFNVADILSGKASDILLKREDYIQIASNKEMNEGFVVQLAGEVLHPGAFPFAENMRIEDLIIAAGGLKESAALNRIEVARRKTDVDRNQKGSEISIVKQFTIQKDLQASSQDMAFVLMPYDMVTVFPSPGYQTQKSVQVEGEVLFPGKYALAHSNDKISDIIKRSGGLSAEAFPNGAMLLRLKPKSIIEDVLQNKKFRALKKQTKDTLDVKENIDEQLQNPYDIVGINLSKIMRNPGSPADLHMNDGDILRIPTEKQTILVSGEVLYPVRLKYEKHRSFKKYISGAGGFGPQALRRHSYVVYANGTARATRNFLLFKWYPTVQPGSEIVVPQRDNRKPVSAVEIASITTSITSLMILVISILKK